MKKKLKCINKWIKIREESLKDKIDRAFKELGIFDLAKQENISELINVEKFKDAEYDKILKLIDTLKDMA